jgi:endonuclease-3
MSSARPAALQRIASRRTRRPAPATAGRKSHNPVRDQRQHSPAALRSDVLIRHTRARRLPRILAALHETYPEAHCELVHSSPLELLIATILSAQCTDKQVNLVTPTLFVKYPSAADYAQASVTELEQDVRRLGFFRSKARNLVACGRALVQQHGGEVPRTMAELVRLAGVGRKTANVVLGNAFGLDEGIVVDTHVSRLSQRLRLTKHPHPEKIEQDLMALVPRAQWTLFSHWLIWHGRRRCTARKPDCARCEIRRWCPSAGRQ